MPGSALASIIQVVERLKAGLDQVLRTYPYPITACDVAFKLYAEQRGHCRVILAGLAHEDGLSERDAHEALVALLATPLPLSPNERTQLSAAAEALSTTA